MESLYQKFAPRWFKVIRWRSIASRTVERNEVNCFMVYFPIFYYFYCSMNPYPLWLCIKQPKTDEERLALKRDTVVISTQRDWEIDQYNHGIPPYMDVWRRRQKYPEHYGDKYNGYARDGFVG